MGSGGGLNPGFLLERDVKDNFTVAVAEHLKNAPESPCGRPCLPSAPHPQRRNALYVFTCMYFNTLYMFIGVLIRCIGDTCVFGGRH